MKRKSGTGSLVLAAAVAMLSAAGCDTGMGAAYWMPSFSNEVQSGASLVDVKRDFGVEADKSVMVFEVKGDAGRMRGRLSYWKVTGAGSKVIDTGPIDFANHTYQNGDITSTTMDLSSIGAYWEPALWMVPKHRVGLVIGVNLISFNMVADDLTNPPAPGDGEVHVPDAAPFDSIGYVPFPVVGLGFETRFNHWLALGVNARAFDTSAIGDPIQDVSALFYGGEAGLYLGDPAKRVVGFAGYRYFHVEYDYGGDTGDGTLEGMVASVAVVF